MTGSIEAANIGEVLRRLVTALGYPNEQFLTRDAVESLVDEWVRAMATIARVVKADPRKPLEVAAAVDEALAGRLPKTDPFDAPTFARTGGSNDVMTIEGGKVYVYVGGVRLRVTGVELA